MNAPVVVVTRGADGVTEIGWWLDEAAWQAGQPEMVIRGYAIRGSSRDLQVTEVVDALCRLATDLRADLSDLATHMVVAGLLVPVQGRAA